MIWKTYTKQLVSREKVSASSLPTTKSKMSPIWSTWTMSYHLERLESQIWNAQCFPSPPIIFPKGWTFLLFQIAFFLHIFCTPDLIPVHNFVELRCSVCLSVVAQVSLFSPFLFSLTLSLPPFLNYNLSSRFFNRGGKLKWGPRNRRHCDWAQFINNRFVFCGE